MPVKKPTPRPKGKAVKPAAAEEKPVALTLKVDGTTYVRLCTLRATQRKTSQEILSEALREYLERADSRR